MSNPCDCLSTDPNVAGVLGENTAGGPGVSGRGTPAGDFESAAGDGVYATSSSPQHCGVAAANDSGGIGVYARGTPGGGFESPSGDGVDAVSHSPQHSGVVGVNDAGGVGVYGKSTGGTAGYFDGNVVVTGDVILTGADCAEEFGVAAAAEVGPGTVMVLDEHGMLQPSQQAYDKKVAGVISGAGDYRPGLILDKKESSQRRIPVALVGKVYCKVDAQYAPIEVGDLLTTSPTSGHAMKAGDPFKAFGSVIGKALRGFEESGTIPLVV